ncbi:MAG: helix-turn-helix domain-containing protein [Clostridia bacterium]|nr:helix-turn-helix domain-containing protein [Clostridia bacterium]
MINTPYVKKDSVSNYFPVPNAVFDLELHHIEIDIYAYLMRIENRRTYQCLASYPTIAKKLGLSVNTVAKYVAALEEHGLIRTERTGIVTKAGLKRNGCLKYTILPIQNAIDIYHERQLAELQRTADIQKVQALAEKKGVEFRPANVSTEGGDQIGA